MAIMRNKPVSFNMENVTEKALLDHANTQQNFSGYVKRLMQEDMKRRQPAMIRTEGGGIKITVKGDAK